MKIIDSEFCEKQGVEYSKYNDIYDQIIKYLKNIINNEKILADMMDNNDYIIIQETLGEEYTIKLPDGSNKKNKLSSSIAALRANMVIGVNQDVVGIRPGVVLRPNYTNHQLIHELIHAISSTQINRFDNEGIVHTKVGTKIDYFNRNLNNYIKIDNLSSDGLNEGITEFLTSVITNEYTGHYPTMVIIAKLLMSSNNNLLNAYFSKDLDELEIFYSDLEEKQSIITRDDLRNLNSKEINEEAIARIIVGAISYNKSYGNELDPDSYRWIINYLDHFYMLDAGSWDDLISSIQNIRKIG